MENFIYVLGGYCLLMWVVEAFVLIHQSDDKNFKREIERLNIYGLSDLVVQITFLVVFLLIVFTAPAIPHRVIPAFWRRCILGKRSK